MPESFSSVQQVMNLSLQDGLEIRLHFPACHFDPDGQWQRGPFRNLIYIRSHNFDVTIIDLIQFHGSHKFEGIAEASAKLYLYIRLADALSFESGAVWHRNGNLGDFNLAAPDFQRPFNHSVMGNIGNDMFVGTDAGWQYLRDIGVGQGRKSVVDSCGSQSIFVSSDLAQRQHKSKDTVFVVPHIGFEIPRFDSPKGECRPVGKAQCVYQG